VVLRQALFFKRLKMLSNSIFIPKTFRCVKCLLGKHWAVKYVGTAKLAERFGREQRWLMDFHLTAY